MLGSFVGLFSLSPSLAALPPPTAAAVVVAGPDEAESLAIRPVIAGVFGKSAAGSLWKERVRRGRCRMKVLDRSEGEATSLPYYYCAKNHVVTGPFRHTNTHNTQKGALRCVRPTRLARTSSASATLSLSVVDGVCSSVADTTSSDRNRLNLAKLSTEGGAESEATPSFARGAAVSGCFLPTAGPA